MAVSEEERASIEAQAALFMNPETTYSVDLEIWAHFPDGRSIKVSSQSGMVGTYAMMRDVRDDLQTAADQIEVAMDKAYGIQRVKKRPPPRAA